MLEDLFHFGASLPVFAISDKEMAYIVNIHLHCRWYISWELRWGHVIVLKDETPCKEQKIRDSVA